jgi:Fe-S cluster assembly scaffold protein SufB
MKEYDYYLYKILECIDGKNNKENIELQRIGVYAFSFEDTDNMSSKEYKKRVEESFLSSVKDAENKSYKMMENGEWIGNAYQIKLPKNFQVKTINLIYRYRKF